MQNCGLGEGTIPEWRRWLRRTSMGLNNLQKDGILETTNPEKMTEKEVGTFVDWLIEKGKKGKDFEHDVSAFNALLKCANNLSVETYRNKNANKYRKHTKTSRLPSLEREDFDKIMQGVEKIDPME